MQSDKNLWPFYSSGKDANIFFADKPIEEVLQSEGGLDYAFDCIGNKAVMDTAVKSLVPWGTLCVNGELGNFA